MMKTNVLIVVHFITIGSVPVADAACKSLVKSFPIYDWEKEWEGKYHWEIELQGAVDIETDCTHAKFDAEVNLTGEAFNKDFDIAKAGLLAELDALGESSYDYGVWIGKYKIVGDSGSGPNYKWEKTFSRRAEAAAKASVGYGPFSVSVKAGAAGEGKVKLSVTLIPANADAEATPGASLIGYAQTYGNAQVAEAKVGADIVFLEDQLINKGHLGLQMDPELGLTFVTQAKGVNQLSGLDGLGYVEAKVLFGAFTFRKEATDIFDGFGFSHNYTLYDFEKRFPLGEVF